MSVKHQEVKKVESLDIILSKLRQLVSAKKLKTSKQRERILTLIYNSKTHLSSEEIVQTMKKNNLVSSISSTYRILQFLENYGFISSLDVDKNRKRYEIAAKEHHYHIICLGCGEIVEFIDDEIRAKQVEIAKSLKYKLISDNLRLFVICNKCQSKQK